MTILHRMIPIVLTSLLATLAACSASTEEAPVAAAEDPAPRPVALRGAYAPSTDDASRATFASFVVESDARYRLRPRGCVDATCEEKGSFRIDMKAKSMTLVVDGTERTYAVPFDVVSSSSASLDDGAAGATTPKNLVGGGGGQLVESQSTLIEASTVLLDGEAYSNDDQMPRCSDSPVFVGSSWSVVSDERAKDAAREDALKKCSSTRCYQPGSPRKFLYCKIRHSECKPGRVYTSCEAFAIGE